MLQIHTLVVGPLQTNCYIVHEEGGHSCCVIDPGYEPERILDALQELGLSLDAILLTHGHFDHVGGVREIAAETGCPVYLCTEDLSMPPMFTAGPIYYTNAYGEGDELHLAGLSFHVLHTPGHTKGSVCLTVDNVMFSGDTLFSGSWGRTDLPGGNWRELTGSLRRLASIQEDYTVYSGHGESTTLAWEKQYNPGMR